MTDLELKRNVESELDWEPSVNAAEIGVAVKDGIVTIQAGELPTPGSPTASVLGKKPPCAGGNDLVSIQGSLRASNENNPSLGKKKSWS